MIERVGVPLDVLPGAFTMLNLGQFHGPERDFCRGGCTQRMWQALGQLEHSRRVPIRMSHAMQERLWVD